MLVVAGALYVIGVVVGYLAALVVPIAIALLLAALLAPGVYRLISYRVPRGLAIVVVVLGTLAGLGGVLTFVILTFINGLPALRTQLADSINTITAWLTTGSLHLSGDQLHSVRDNLLAALSANQTSLTAGALTTAATIGQTLAQMVLVLFTLVFLLHEGAGIWRFLLGAAPAARRARVDVAGRRALAALVSYVRATAAVADAVGIGVGLAILGVPLAVPLTALAFLGAFIPIIGTVIAGVSPCSWRTTCSSYHSVEEALTR
ncbi:MAG: AI-2E family transporter [Pseudonocardia sp.]|nr:AI-2E family transporter [Pseudonocardia sp.]